MSKIAEKECGDCHACYGLSYGELGDQGEKVLQVIDRIGNKYAYALGPVLCEVFEQTDLSVEWIVKIIHVWIKDEATFSRDGHIDSLSSYLRKQIALSKNIA